MWESLSQTENSEGQKGNFLSLVTDYFNHYLEDIDLTVAIFLQSPETMFKTVKEKLEEIIQEFEKENPSEEIIGRCFNKTVMVLTLIGTVVMTKEGGIILKDVESLTKRLEKKFNEK